MGFCQIDEKVGRRKNLSNWVVDLCTSSNQSPPVADCQIGTQRMRGLFSLQAVAFLRGSRDILIIGS